MLRRPSAASAPATCIPSYSHEGKTYEIDDNLASEFDTLGLIEKSNEEPVEALPEDGRDDLHENWLDLDSAVLRHGELTAQEVVAKDESPFSEEANLATQVEGKAEGEVDADADPEADTDEAEAEAEADDKASSKAKKSK